VIQPLLPNEPRGVPRVDDRRVLKGIFWRLRTRPLWADIPECYGTVHDLGEPFNRRRQPARRCLRRQEEDGYPQDRGSHSVCRRATSEEYFGLLRRYRVVRSYGFDNAHSDRPVLLVYCS
jgi:transposase